MRLFTYLCPQTEKVSKSKTIKTKHLNFCLAKNLCNWCKFLQGFLVFICRFLQQIVSKSGLLDTTALQNDYFWKNKVFYKTIIDKVAFWKQDH